ncbi:MAG: sel1 repeat family protein, partial [Muribaculaceae bacterium]|nr:sel1 repeat family protein [Muribaculaceae bacterium]
ADCIINLSLYHNGWNASLAERFLKLVSDKNTRGKMELGVIYAFSPEFSKHASEGVKLLQEASHAGSNDANAYLGLYYFTHKDYKKARAYLESCNPMPFGFGDTALGSMYLAGYGVKSDPAKAREYYHQAALKGYPRGAALYGFNLRANAGGSINYPDSFFWLYVSGDLGDDAARTVLFLPRRNENRGDSEESRDANLALQWISAVNTGKRIQDEPIYKDGFLPGLKGRERAAEQGDDWSRFYLGSMNYNGDFLNQNYTQVLHYYEPIAQNGRLPKNVLALVHERLAEMYREGKGTEVNPAKAAYHARAAAQLGSLPSYLIIENISQ